MSFMLRIFVALVGGILCLEGFAENQCCNIHCTFRYLGYAGFKEVEEFSASSFLSVPVFPQAAEDAFPSFKELRALDMHLYLLECAAEGDDALGMTNAISAVSRLLDTLSQGEGREIVAQALEMVSFSIVRLMQGRCAVAFDAATLDLLLPERFFVADDMPRSLKTFKRMIVIAGCIEKYRRKRETLPITLDETEVPECHRKCAYGRDIEYDHSEKAWVLRCACDSWCGGLDFDEYLPGILSDRKKFPLFLSSSFSQKRRDVFSGEWAFTSDERLTCRIDHASKGVTNGFHMLKYKRPGAGAARFTIER